MRAHRRLIGGLEAWVVPGTAHEISRKGLLISNGQSIYLLESLESMRARKVTELPGILMKLMGANQLLDRVAKASVQYASWFDDLGILAKNRAGWWLRENNGVVQKVPLSLPGSPMARSICRSTTTSTVYYGEYSSNPDRGPVRIWSSQDLVKWTVAWEFPSCSIRHVHAVIQDEIDEARVWVLTGDYDHESVIYYTDDEFSTLNIAFSLGQESRATDLAFRKESIIYGMDSPYVRAHLMKFERSLVADPVTIQEMPGPVYYFGKTTKSELYASTACEPGPRSLANQCTIYRSTGNDVWSRFLTFKPSSLPGHSIVTFPRGTLPEKFLVFSLKGVHSLHSKIVVIPRTSQ